MRIELVASWLVNLVITATAQRVMFPLPILQPRNDVEHHDEVGGMRVAVHGDELKVLSKVEQDEAAEALAQRNLEMEIKRALAEAAKVNPGERAVEELFLIKARDSVERGVEQVNQMNSLGDMEKEKETLDVGRQSMLVQDGEREKGIANYNRLVAAGASQQGSRHARIHELIKSFKESVEEEEANQLRLRMEACLHRGARSTACMKETGMLADKELSVRYVACLKEKRDVELSQRSLDCVMIARQDAPNKNLQAKVDLVAYQLQEYMAKNQDVSLSSLLKRARIAVTMTKAQIERNNRLGKDLDKKTFNAIAQNFRELRELTSRHGLSPATLAIVVAGAVVGTVLLGIVMATALVLALRDSKPVEEPEESPIAQSGGEDPVVAVTVSDSTTLSEYSHREPKRKRKSKSHQDGKYHQLPSTKAEKHRRRK